MEVGHQVNGAREWFSEGRRGANDAETTRPHSALSNSSSSYTVSSSSIPRSSPSPSTYGESNETTTATNKHPSPKEERRPNSVTGMGNVEMGLFRRSKSTPSLQEKEEDDDSGRRRSLWGWGQRPNLPPTHFYYLPHQPPRNKELREEDIPDGVDRVKKIKERIEGDSQRSEETSPESDVVNGDHHNNSDNNYAAVEENKPKKKKDHPYGTNPPYRTPSFGGSMTHLHRNKSNTLPHRATSIHGSYKKGQTSADSSPSWRSTLPRDNVSNMYWNGISTIAHRGRKTKSLYPQKGHQDELSNDKTTSHQVESGEVRVSRSTLERIRERGSSVTYYGGRVVKQGRPADPTHVIMEEIRKQRESEDTDLVEDLSGALKALGKQNGDWGEEGMKEGRQDSSYGSAESTPAGTPAPSVAPTPPPPPSPTRPLSPSTAKVVSTIAKKGSGENLLHPNWSGKCSVVFDFRRVKEVEQGERVCF